MTRFSSGASSHFALTRRRRPARRRTRPSQVGILVPLAFVLGAFTLACVSPPAGPKADNLTVGKVQGEIKVGMDAAAVAEILGSPNIVTTDEKRREVWIYDKISSESVSRSSSVGGGLIIFGGGSRSSASSKSQKTLTVIIKFDENKKVRDFAYNYSQF